MHLTLHFTLCRLYLAPNTRQAAQLDLSLLLSPYTELPHNGDRVAGASAALLSALRSWPGLLHLTRPPAPPLASLLQTLHLPSYQTRTAVLDLLFRSLSLPCPDWTDEFSVAMRSADPSAAQPAWRLTEGFVAAEGADLLPHLARSRPNLLESHTALLLSSYLQCGLPAALVSVIVTSDTVLSVRAAVLLGQVLQLVSKLLPHEISATQQCLPSLAAKVPYSTISVCCNELNFV